MGIPVGCPFLLLAWRIPDLRSGRIALFMLSKKPVRVFLLVVAVIFFLTTLGTVVLRLHSCSFLEKPARKPPAYASEWEVNRWIVYKKMCRNYVSYYVLFLSGGYLISRIGKYRNKPLTN